MATSMFRAKTYANKEGKANGGKPNKVQVSGNVAAFEAFVNKDKDATDELRKQVAEALKA